MRQYGEPELDEFAGGQRAPAQAPPEGAAIGAIASGMGNAAFASMLTQQPAAAAPLLQRDRRPQRYKDKDKSKKEDDDEAKEEAGLLGVISKVNTAIKAISGIHQAWDEVFKVEVKTEFHPIPQMVAEGTPADLNRALRYETSRLLCEYVFEKAKMYGVDIRKIVDERDAKKDGPDADEAPTPTGEKPKFAALEKDLEGLNELAIGDLKDQAVGLIDARQQTPMVRPDRFWWNENDDWGFSDPPLLETRFGSIKAIEYGEIIFQPRIGKLDRPINAGLHPDVKYFNIPVLNPGVVRPLWWAGGYIETKTHGRNVNAVSVNIVEPVPKENKPMGEFYVVTTFDWDESDTTLKCVLRAPGGDHASAVGIERSGTPNTGWV
jgi:hypothetical protein